MKKKVSILLAGLLAITSLSVFSACDLSDYIGISDLDILGSVVESSSEPTSESESESSEELEQSSKEESEEEKTPETPNVVGGVDFSLPDVTEQYGYAMLASEQNGAKMQQLYKAVYNACAEFSKSDKDVAETDGEYRIASVPILQYGLPIEQAVAVWATVRKDYSEFWWLDNGLSYSQASLYVRIHEDYRLCAKRKDIEAKLQTLALDCAQYVSETDGEAERALDIYEYLSTHFTYAYESDGKTPSTAFWAHNLVGGALYKKGVCETYAKTYEWFCELFGLDCTTVEGLGVTKSGTENHEWNAVRIDGEWYGVDATWSNATDGENIYVSRKWLGMGKTEFDSSHVARYTKNYGIDYQIPAPTLSESYLCPVYFGKKGERKVFARSLDEAFSKMTEPTAHYEVELYPDTEILRATGKKLYPRGATFVTATLPSVAQIDIIGRNVFVTATAYYKSYLTFRNNVTLQSKLTTLDVELENEQYIKTNGYTFYKKFTN